MSSCLLLYSRDSSGATQRGPGHTTTPLVGGHHDYARVMCALCLQLAVYCERLDHGGELGELCGDDVCVCVCVCVMVGLPLPRAWIWWTLSTLSAVLCRAPLTTPSSSPSSPSPSHLTLSQQLHTHLPPSLPLSLSLCLSAELFVSHFHKLPVPVAVLWLVR